MTAFFSDVFREAVFDDATLFDGAHDVVAVLFRNAPVFVKNDARYTGIDTISELQAQLGWEPPSGQSNPLSMAAYVTLGTHYLRLENPFVFPSTFPPSFVRAIAFVYQGTLGGVTNPIMMVTSTPVADGRVIYSTDGIYARPDTTAADTNGNPTRWLLSWSPPPVASPPPTFTAQRLDEGPVAMLRGAPPFDTSRTQHVWLYPQRVNLLANPSFEAIPVSHWRSNGNLIQVKQAADGGGVIAGQFSGGSPIIVESNIFPLNFGFTTERMWTVMANARGSGLLYVGLITWPADYGETSTDWGDGVPVPLSPQGWTTMRLPRDTGGMSYGMLRLESDGDELILDNLMVEPNWLPDWWYFDGDTTYGAPDDFFWYGGCRGASYSLWYNNRRAIVGRLFAWQENPEDQAQLLPPVWQYDPTSYDPKKWMTEPPATVLNRLFSDDVPILMDTSLLSSDKTKVLNQSADDAITAGSMDGTITGLVLEPEDKGYWWFPPTVNNTMIVPDQPELDITASMTVTAEIEPPSWNPASEMCIISRWGNAGVTPGVLGFVDPNKNGVRSPSPVPAGDKTLFQITGNRTIIARVRFGDSNGEYQQIAGVWEPNEYAWFFGVGPGNHLRFHWSANGTGTTDQIQFSSVGGFGVRDVWIGVKINYGANSFQAITSNDGVAWTNWGAEVDSLEDVTMSDTFLSDAPLRIGAGVDDAGAFLRNFQGRIYSVEMRTGLNPTAGTLQWRMFASDATVVTGNADWTDPRGRTWHNAISTTISKPTNGVSVNSSWILTLQADGKLQFLWAKTPVYPWTSQPFAWATSTAAVTGTLHRFISVTYIGNNGQSKKEIAFWTSTDGADWRQLGTTYTDATPEDLQVSSGRIEVTTRDLGGAIRSMQAKVYSAQVNKGIGARLGTGLPQAKVVTTANITLSGLQTIDGVALAAGNRVLVKSQTDAKTNGVYAAATTAWTRTTDFDTGTELAKARINVTAGTANANTTWVCDATTLTLGTDNVTFTQVGSNGFLPGGEPVVNINCDLITDDDVAKLTFKAVTGQDVQISRGTSGYVSTGMPHDGRAVVMLDGVDDKVSIPDNAVLNTDQDFAMVMALNQKIAPKAAVVIGGGTFYASKLNSASPYAGWSVPSGTGPQVMARLRGTNITLETGYTGMPLNTPVAVGFSVDKEGGVTTLYSFRDDLAGRSANSSTLVLANTDNTQPILVGSGYSASGQGYEQFDFYAMALIQGPLNSNELAAIATALRDASDVYFNGNRWSITADGQFKGLDLKAGDVLVARHPQGLNSPMSFDQVDWDVQALVGGVTTNIEVEKQGLVYKWIPAGTLVEPHIGVLAPGDIAVCPADVSGDVLPYRTDPDDLTGVLNPWPLDTEPPSAPVLSIDSIETMRIHLSWTASSGGDVFRYYLERCSGVGCTAFAPRQDVDASTLTLIDAGLTIQTSYSYRIRARDAAGNYGPWSNTVTGITMAQTYKWDDPNTFWDDAKWE